MKDTTSREIGPHDVLVRITHSGLCGTDVHVKNQDIALGHGGAAVVEEVGNAVTLFKKCAMQSPPSNLKQVTNAPLQRRKRRLGLSTGILPALQAMPPWYRNVLSSRKIYSEANLDQGSMGSHPIWRRTSISRSPTTSRTVSPRR